MKWHYRNPFRIGDWRHLAIETAAGRQFLAGQSLSTCERRVFDASVSGIRADYGSLRLTHDPLTHCQL
jgi:hypothetical protein